MLKNRLKKVFRSYGGRHFLSRWGRHVFEKSRVREILGLNLAAFFVVVSVFVPQTQALASIQTVEKITPEELPAIETKTVTTLSWPVKEPTITQNYHFGHWGIDIQTKGMQDLSIYPIDEGKVTAIAISNWGYGKHLLVEHPNGRSSLYGHFDSINVAVGDSVTRETVLGQMGATGWASGIHLHLEIWQDGKLINPLEVLPAL